MRKPLFILCAVLCATVQVNATDLVLNDGALNAFAPSSPGRAQYRIARLPAVLPRGDASAEPSAARHKVADVEAATLRVARRNPLRSGNAIAPATEPIEIQTDETLSLEESPTLETLRPSLATAAGGLISLRPSIHSTVHRIAPITDEDDTSSSVMPSPVAPRRLTSLISEDLPAGDDRDGLHTIGLPPTEMPPTGNQRTGIRESVLVAERVPFASSKSSMQRVATRSIMQTISEQGLLEGKQPYRIGLSQLQAAAIKNSQNLGPSQHQFVRQIIPLEQTFDWNAFPSAPVSSSASRGYRIKLNYVQHMLPPIGATFDGPSVSYEVLQADLDTQDPKMVSAVLRQLDTVAVEYWQLVAERGKLLAAADHLEYCQMMLDSYGQQGALVAQLQAAYDSSLAKHQEAIQRAELAQKSVLSLVNDAGFSQNVELVTADLPQSMMLESLDRAIATAGKNRVDAKSSPGSLTLDVQTAHQQLKFAVQTSNRTLKSVAKVAADVTLTARLANRVISEQLMIALSNQDRLRDSQSAFLDAVANQQKAVIAMRRAKGTLIRTKRLGTVAPTVRQVAPQYGQPGTWSPAPNQPVGFPATAPQATAPQSNVPRTSHLPPQRARQFEFPRLSWKPVPKDDLNLRHVEEATPLPMFGSTSASSGEPTGTSKYRTAAKKFLSQFGKPSTAERILDEAEASK